jgi:cysteine synthase A
MVVPASSTRQFEIPLDIGNTSMCAIAAVVNGRVSEINLKLEGENKYGSIKDRTAFFLLDAAKQDGSLGVGGTVVESTSGNLGVALGYMCPAQGYNFIAVIDPKTTKENVERLSATSAHIECVTQPDETGGYLLTRLDRVAELCRENPSYVWTNQYGNPANPTAHFLTTAPEIFWQMKRRIDAIFLPVSTGGTLAGVSRFIRTVSPSTVIVAVDAQGSIAISGSPGPRKLTGIGSSRRAEFLDAGVFDELMLVNDSEAFALCNYLYATTALKVGGSSGATLAACLKFLAMTNGRYRRVVCLCPDRGENYESTIFNRQWLIENGFGGFDFGTPLREFAVELRAA